MPPFATTGFGRKALGNMPGRRGQPARTSRGGGAGGTAAKTPTLDMILSRVWGGMLTPAQQRKQARQEANFAMQDSLRGMRMDYQREYEQLRREGEAYKQVQSILGSYSGSDAAAIREAYNAAAGGIAGVNTGLISSVQGAQQGALDTATQNAVATTGVAPQDQAGPTQNVIPSTFLGVTNPSEAAAGTGAALGEGALAKGMAIAQQAGQRVTQELAGQIAELRDEYLMQRSGLRAKKPALIREALNAIQERGQGDIATLISGLTLANTATSDLMDFQSDAADRARKTQDALRKAKTDKQKQKIENLAARGISADGKTPLPGFYRHPSGRILEAGTYIAPDGSVQDVPSDYRVGKGGKLVRDPSSSAAKDPAQAERYFKADALAWAEKQINVDEDLGRPLRTPPSKQVLIKKIMALYGQPLLGQGYSESQVRAWAQQVVNSFPASYWKKKTPGKTGSSGTTSGVKPVDED